jgi:hypothetical protein
MHAVVNHLPLKPGSDWDKMISLFDPFFAEVRRQHPRMKAALLLRAGDAEAIFVGVYEDLETMRHVSSNVAAPWFAENIRPFLGGPAQRTEAPVVAGSI